MIVLTVDILDTFQDKTQSLIHTNDASFQNDGLPKWQQAYTYIIFKMMVLLGMQSYIYRLSYFYY